MRKIIQVEKLYDNYQNLVIGYIGLDLETKNFKYYSHYNQNQVWDPYKLYEFNPQDLNAFPLLAQALDNCQQYKDFIFALPIPKKITQLIQKYIKAHLKYNEQNHYPTDFIQYNKNFLTIRRHTNFSMFRDDCHLASYEAIKNRINLPVDISLYSDLNKKDQQIINSCLIHELGHMKATQFKIDETSNTLYVQMGFYHYEDELTSINTFNGDTFYLVKEKNLSQNNLIQIALEELINEYDCANVLAKYHYVYPNLGQDLQNLCNKKLTYIRYNSCIEEVYDILFSIIKSADLVIELMEHIKDIFYGKEKEKSLSLAKNILKKYEQKK